MKRVIVCLAIGLLCIAGWWVFTAHDTANASLSDGKAAIGSPQQANSSALAGAQQSRSSTDLGADTEKTRQAKIAQWRAKLEFSQRTYDSYRDDTRYPFVSRSISQAPDQVRPFEPVVSDKVLRNERGEPIQGIKIKASQDRVFLSGKDSAKFTLQALDENGKSLPLIINRASATSLQLDGMQPGQARSSEIAFSDAGSSATGSADDVAQDGIYTARLTPANQGFAGYSGPIRTTVSVRADGKDGIAILDLTYTEGIPATWGTIREAQEEGSLNFYLKANIATAGRYVVSVRVDDAKGQPFAILRFNEEVAVGSQEFKMHLFGLLIRDKNPAFPLKLRGASGYLLFPKAFPDRLMMAQRPGVVHTSRSYSIESFTADEWSSERRDRHLAEYGRQIDRARSELEQLGVR